MKSYRLLFIAGACLGLFGACGNDKRPIIEAPGSGGSAQGGMGGEEGEPILPEVEESLFGTPVPSFIEAEHFVRALESDSAQEGSATCQSEVDAGVDIESNDTASGGCNIGYSAGGEWLEYDIAVSETGAFDFSFALASELPGRSLSFSIDGVTRGSATAPTDGWSTFSGVVVEGVGIERGDHVLRITFGAGGVNLDSIDITKADKCIPACDGKSCGDDFCGSTCGTCEGEKLCSSASQCVGDYPKPVEVHGQLSVKNGKIVDKNDEPVQLRGVSTQWLNFDFSYGGNAEAMEFMRDNWGMEVYRIANGVEGSKGYADPASRPAQLARVKQIIRDAIALDVYVIVDWHTHESSYQDLAEEFFTDIATEFGHAPNIIYETFNEPVGDSDAESAQFWTDELKPYHEALVQTIRAIDDNNVIVLGTPRWSQKVDVAAADPVEGTNLAYGLHFYSCTHGQWLIDRAQAALNSGIALFVTEWASTHADGGTRANPGTCIGTADTWHEFLDENDIGSAAWKLNADGDASAILGAANASGPWEDRHLSDHGKYVRNLLQRP